MAEYETGGRTGGDSTTDGVLLGRLGGEERDALILHWLGVQAHNQELFALADAEPGHAGECAGPDEVRRLSQAEWRLAALGFDPRTDRDRELITAVEGRFRAAGVEAGGPGRECLTGGSAV